MSKPTLHEIAAMPFPASRNAMRKNYVPKWGMPESDGKLHDWSVRVDYKICNKSVWIVKVKAVDQEEAIELSEEAFDSHFGTSDMYEVTNVDAKLVDQ